MTLTDEELSLAQAVADDLLGTCQTLEEVLSANDAMQYQDNLAFLDEIDSLAMQCEGCNWWTQPAELDDIDYCSDCREEGNE
jgi:hypothetical protein